MLSVKLLFGTRAIAVPASLARSVATIVILYPYVLAVISKLAEDTVPPGAFKLSAIVLVASEVAAIVTSPPPAAPPIIRPKLRSLVLVIVRGSTISAKVDAVAVLSCAKVVPAIRANKTNVIFHDK
ncbi:hypothetical protein GCM10007103_10810 [Salinimicrobium marinum]|uniref:Uncharacterized protein n=1 Tax=Salinimicrobium marinum TaxID=680283 RepID=A0A918SA80_9FLAO|nr:hypothetical protein GCM10007103_10810 [Salinimicrobium marinum]